MTEILCTMELITNTRYHQMYMLESKQYFKKMLMTIQDQKASYIPFQPGTPSNPAIDYTNNYE